jgi:uncharacterized protein YggU (UPF0235/DUF167 family)
MNITVIVHPNSKNPRIEKDLFGQLNIYVNQPPLEGRANLAVVEALADYFKVKKYQVQMSAGRKSKQKTFVINI